MNNLKNLDKAIFSALMNPKVKDLSKIFEFIGGDAEIRSLFDEFLDGEKEKRGDDYDLFFNEYYLKIFAAGERKYLINLLKKINNKTLRAALKNGIVSEDTHYDHDTGAYGLVGFYLTEFESMHNICSSDFETKSEFDEFCKKKIVIVDDFEKKIQGAKALDSSFRTEKIISLI